jgi:Histidine kinase-, DNA gyrase B-, and HSP90-like ATPase
MGLENAWQPLRINIRNVIADFLDMYSSSPEEVMITEAIANSLDAHPNRIVIGLKETPGKSLFTIADDGLGMSEATFEKSYHALALSTKAKGQSIGFAGVGGKLYLAMLEAGRSIYTETRSGSFWGASELGMKGDEATWRRIEPRGEVSTKTGTCIEVEIRKDALDRSTIERTVQESYGAVLAGMWGDVSIFLQWRPEKLSWVPPSSSTATTANSESFAFRVKNKKCVASFWLAGGDFDSPKGVDIAVLGKKVKAEQWFNLQFEVRPEFSRRVYGLVNADVLAKLLTANKQDLRGGNDATWQEFRRKTYQVFRRWLLSIGAIQKSSSSLMLRPGEGAMTREVSKAIAEVLRQPDLGAYRLGLSSVRERGDSGSRAAGSSKTDSLQEDIAPQARLQAEGPEMGEQVKDRVEASQPSAAGGARAQGATFDLSMSYRPGMEEEAWVGPGGIVINSAHPVFKKSRELGVSIEASHIIRAAFMVMMENSDPSKKQVLDELRTFYRAWARISPRQKGD